MEYFIKLLISVIVFILNILLYFRELHLGYNMLRSLPHELGRLFQLQVLSLAGNPLCQEVMKLYSEPNGTHRLLMYLLDSLQGKIIYFISSIH